MTTTTTRDLRAWCLADLGMRRTKKTPTSWRSEQSSVTFHTPEKLPSGVGMCVCVVV